MNPETLLFHINSEDRDGITGPVTVASGVHTYMEMTGVFLVTILQKGPGTTLDVNCDRSVHLFVFVRVGRE